MFCFSYLCIIIDALDMWSDDTTLLPFLGLMLQTCIACRNYKVAIPYIDKNILSIGWSKETSGVTIENYLLYHYYSGMIYTGLKRYNDASNAFLLCVSVPSVGLSEVSVMAYKKWILVSLLAHGSVPELPAYSSSIATARLPRIASKYIDFKSKYIHI